MKQIFLVTAIILAGLMAIAALPLPSIGYYQFLRVITFFGCAALIYYFYSVKGYAWIPCLVLLLILFNPISPFYLGREVWVYVNILATIFFASMGYKLSRPDNQ